ncbi:MAG: hypothetical protein HY926_15585 [Elusimicrobia bacterium]|nr:hypothetical protein [Elusimicrobiota bacterium]
MNVRHLAVLAALAGLAACASAGRRAQPVSPSAGLLIGAMRFQKLSIPVPDRYADMIHLAPVDAKGEMDLDRLVSSQWAADRQVYFFNLPPGRYAVLGGSYLAHGLRYTFRFKPEQSRQLLAEAVPGEVRFLGVAIVRREFQGGGAFLGNMLKSAAVVLPPWRPWTTKVLGALRALDDSRLAEVDALAAARRDLAGTLWSGPVGARLNRLGGPPPPSVTTGFWRKRSKPQRPAETFSWVDTLEWGEPRPVKGGLEWRQPKDRARIAVLFRREGDAGFQPVDDYLRELRGLGSLEDSHAFEETVISTAVARVIRYTKYVYPEPYLTGSVKVVYLTEVSVVPGSGGYYVLHYRARKEDFAKLRGDYLRFRSQLRLFPPPKEEGKT